MGNEASSREYFRKRALEIKRDEIACEDENLLRELVHHIYFVSNDDNIKEDILWLCQPFLFSCIRSE